MEAQIGPPLPTVLDVKWPWYKPPAPVISFTVSLDGIYDDAYAWQLQWFDNQNRLMFTSGFASSPAIEVPNIPGDGAAFGHIGVEVREYSGASRGTHNSPVIEVKQGGNYVFDWINSNLV